MKTLAKTILVGTFAIVAMSSELYAGKKEAAISLKVQEEILMEEIVAHELEDLAFLASFETEASIYFYDAQGLLVHEARISQLSNPETKKLLKKSDFLADVDGSQYFLLSR